MRSDQGLLRITHNNSAAGGRAARVWKEQEGGGN